MSFSEEKSNSRYEFAKKIQGESDSETSKNKGKIENKNSIEDETKIIKFEKNSEPNKVSLNLFKNNNQIGKNFDKNLNANEKKFFRIQEKNLARRYMVILVYLFLDYTKYRIKVIFVRE